MSILCGLGRRLNAGVGTIDWDGLAADYAEVRTHISHVIPGFEAYNDKIARPGGFLLPHPPRDSRTFATDTGRAHFSVTELVHLRAPPPSPPPDPALP